MEPDPPGPEIELELPLTGPDQVDGLPLASGGDLFVNSCREQGATLVCEPWRIRISAGGVTTTTKLPEVTQAITHDRLEHDPSVIAISGLVGSTIDAAHRRVFWHADCDASYHVTDLESGTTETFALDLDALGVTDQSLGFCLQEWMYDDARGRAIAIGGRQDRLGGANNEKSRVELVLAVDAHGGVEVLHDLRGKIDPRYRFLHEFQTIASRDHDSEDVIAPLAMAPSTESQLVLNLTSGDVTVATHGGARVHRFYDVVARQQTALDCNVPGLTSTHIGTDPNPRIPIPRAELVEQGMTGCVPGFVGGAYDPVSGKELLFMHGSATPADGAFVIAVADLRSDRWLGFFETDATFGALGMTDVGNKRLFMSTEFAAARQGPDGGPSLTVDAGVVRRYRTEMLPPGSYEIAITGVGNADLLTRVGAPPTLSDADCRPSRGDTNESCGVTLASPARVHVMVQGVGDTSTLQLRARAL